MEGTVSVSKGVFLFPNGFKKRKTKHSKPRCIFDYFFEREPWYVTFKRNWKTIETSIEHLHRKTYSLLLSDIVSYVKSSHDCEAVKLQGVIPSATLLTGINQPDHLSQFTTLIEKIREEVTPHIAMINSQDAPTIKHLVENSVWQIVHGHESLVNYDSNDSDNECSEIHKPIKKKSQCTMKALQNWYLLKYLSNTPKKKRHSTSLQPVVIIIQDFEGFNCNVLQDFVMITSSYVPSLPIVFIFGVATSVSALHKSFPYHVSSKLMIKVFHSHSSPVYMNQVLENLFLTHTSPLHLSGKAFELLTDVFLFYDFSVKGLIQSIKYCIMIDHYYGDNTKSLCCEREKLEEAIKNLNADDLENIRQLMSFRPYLEAQDCQRRINLFQNDNVFKDVLLKEMNRLHDYLFSFHTCIRILAAFVIDLPRSILGKTVREIYAKCAVEQITLTSAFRECIQFLNFQSQVKLVENIKNALKFVNAALKITSSKPLRNTPTKNNLSNMQLNDDLGENYIKTVRVHLLMFLRQIENANTEASLYTHEDSMEVDMDTENVPGNRYKLKEKLLKAAKVEKIQSEFEMIRSRLISYLEEMFNKGLKPPHTQTFHEILFFSDISNVKKQIVGSPRGAIHTALCNPTHYLQCTCCVLQSADSIVPTLPDVSLVYKLHRECGKHINLYDWLQAFATVLSPDVEDDERQQDPVIQARFMRAVAELQFLGFIKSSKRKTDHVMRLTW